MELNLREKVAIVTGAGRGIGRAIALTLANEGASVIVNDIDLKVAEDVAKNIISTGSRSLAVKSDVTKVDQVNMMVKQTLDNFGKVDILINNAGITYDASGPLARNLFETSSIEEWHREIDLILYGTLYCVKAVIGHMIKQRSGRIVNISTDLGRTAISGMKGVSIYGAAKGGVIALTRLLAMELGSHGITINTVCPGMVRTTRASLAEEQKEMRPKEYEFFKTSERIMLEITPLGSGHPEDIAKLVVFLASDAARWITGQTYSVNGGQVMI